MIISGPGVGRGHESDEPYRRDSRAEPATGSEQPGSCDRREVTVQARSLECHGRAPAAARRCRDSDSALSHGGGSEYDHLHGSRPGHLSGRGPNRGHCGLRPARAAVRPGQPGAH